jgi:hypothetical protein
MVLYALVTPVHASYCTLHLMLWIFLVVSHNCAFTIDPAEQEPEELQEQPPVEDTNHELEQGNPQCI